MLILISLSMNTGNIKYRMKKKPITYKKKIYYNPIFIEIFRFIYPLIFFFAKVKIKSIEGKIPNKGPLLIASHHEEVVDPFVIDLAAKRRLFWVADLMSPNSEKRLPDTKFFKWITIRMGIIPIDKKNTKRNVNLFDYLFCLLNKGEAIVFFPEVYLRFERAERFGKFKDGVVRVALEYEKRFNKKIPIYPLGLNYVKNKNIKEANIKIGNVFFVKSRKDKTGLFNEIKRLSST